MRFIYCFILLHVVFRFSSRFLLINELHFFQGEKSSTNSNKKSRHRRKKNKKPSDAETVLQKIENTPEIKLQHKSVEVNTVINSKEDKSLNDKVELEKSHVNLNTVINKDTPKISKMNTPQQNLSRDEVMAEREAKKLAKQIAKKKSTEKKQADVPKTTQTSKNAGDKKPSQPPKTTEPISIPKSTEDKNASQSPKTTEQISIHKSVTPQSPIKPVQSSAPPIIENKSTTIKSSHTDKTKEEVKAEREAKRLAKQIAKMKVKDNTDNIKTVGDDSKLKTEKNVGTSVSKQETKDDKSKSELRAERRAKQEAQRAAKQAQTEKVPEAPQPTSKPVVKPKIVLEVCFLSYKIIFIEIGRFKYFYFQKSQSPEKTKSKTVNNEHKVKLFNHLYPEKEFASTFSSMNIPMNSK